MCAPGELGAERCSFIVAAQRREVPVPRGRRDEFHPSDTRSTAATREDALERGDLILEPSIGRFDAVAVALAQLQALGRVANLAENFFDRGLERRPRIQERFDTSCA